MKDENEGAPDVHTGLHRRKLMTMLAGCTVGLMVPSVAHGEGKTPRPPLPVPTG